MNTKPKTPVTEEREDKIGFAEYLLIGGGLLIVGMFVFAAIQLNNLPGF